MFLKTESFEYNGVTVTLSELSALQRIEHLALMKQQAESDSNRKFTVEDVIRTGAFGGGDRPCGITIRRRRRCRP